VPGLSENIRVRSVIGRFLEHSRIYRFGNDGRPRMGLSSADWMTRNLNRRIEHLVWIEPGPIQQALDGILAIYRADTAQARELQPDGSYQPVTPDLGEEPFSCQEEFIRRAEDPATAALPGEETGARETSRAGTRFVAMRRPAKP
jgi:polyphosphate kinase